MQKNDIKIPTIAQMRKEIAEDKETKHLVDLSDRDVLTIYNYFKNRDKIIDGYKTTLKTFSHIEVIKVRTEEKELELRQLEFFNQQKLFESDEYSQKCFLKDFKVTNDEQQKAKQVASDFIKKFNQNTFLKGIYLNGRYSTGKTFLLSAIANELLKKNVKVIFVFMPALARIIKDGMEEHDLRRRIEILENADVLMLDDIGGEHVTAWFRDEILVPLIQKRMNNKKPILFSSNKKMSELYEHFLIYTAEDELKSSRITNRIKDTCQNVELSEKTYKRFKSIKNHK